MFMDGPPRGELALDLVVEAELEEGVAEARRVALGQLRGLDGLTVQVRAVGQYGVAQPASPSPSCSISRWRLLIFRIARTTRVETFAPAENEALLVER
jgi:hypothetical protein